jgi:hypothetical protein
MSTSRLASLYNLEDLALETGATIEYADGRKFNTVGMQGKRQLKQPAKTPEVAPAPAPTPAPPVADNSAIVSQLLELLNRPVQVSLPEMPTPNVVVNQPAAAPVTAWTFEFERNPNGTIKRIRATPDA